MVAQVEIMLSQVLPLFLRLLLILPSLPNIMLHHSIFIRSLVRWFGLPIHNIYTSNSVLSLLNCLLVILVPSTCILQVPFLVGSNEGFLASWSGSEVEVRLPEIFLGAS